MKLEPGIIPTEGEARKEAVDEMLRRVKYISDNFKDSNQFDKMLESLTPFAEKADLVLELDRKFGLICELYNQPRDRWTIIGRGIFVDGGSTNGYVELKLATDTISDRQEGFLHLRIGARRCYATIRLRSYDMLKFQLIEIADTELKRFLSGNPDIQKEHQ